MVTETHVADRLLTAESLLATPGAGNLTELVEGKLVQLSPAFYEHGKVASRIHVALALEARKTQAGDVVSAETGFVVARDPDTVRVPDVAFVRADRIPVSGVARFFEGAPDLAVEVVSASDTSDELERKVQQYLKAGCQLAWVVYPSLRATRVWRQDGSTTLVTDDEALSGEDVLPGFALPLSEVFL